jgi:hypothetical protein
MPGKDFLEKLQDLDSSSDIIRMIDQSRLQRGQAFKFLV